MIIEKIMEQTLFMMAITIPIPVAYTLLEFVSCLIIIWIKKKLIQSLSFWDALNGAFFRFIPVRILFYILSFATLSSISFWNYYRILANPARNDLMYLDTMVALFSSVNNEDLSPYYLPFILIGTPLSYILILIFLWRTIGFKSTKLNILLWYLLILINSLSLVSVCYVYTVALMGI